MARFVEYFSIIGISNDPESYIDESGSPGPQVLQRIPDTDWKDFVFPAQLADVCNPFDWKPIKKPKRPIYFCNALTDQKGQRCYYASFIFYELTDDKLYVPKVMTIVSRIPYYENFKDCLSCIFKLLYKWSLSGNPTTLTEVISNLIYNDFDSLQGSRDFEIRMDNFSTHLYPSLSLMIPTTGDYVYTLLKLVGVHNLISLYSALLLDNKIVFISKSLTYLYKSAMGLISIIYPMNFMYVFIPVLPKTLTEMLNVPTPFIIGVHSSCDIDTSESHDVLIMNLDTGYLFTNDEYKVPLVPEMYYKMIQKYLIAYAHPESGINDYAFPKRVACDPLVVDKYIRACFFYISLRLLAGYRPCTTYARLIPNTVMRFHPSLFLARREISKSEFYASFLKTTAFEMFISERGPTYRVSDYFDEMINYFDYNYKEDVDSVHKFVEQFASYFMHNEPICDPKNRYKGVNYQLLISDIDLQNVKIPDFDFSQIPVPENVPESMKPPVIVKTRLEYDLTLFQHDLVYYINHRRKKMIRECVEQVFQNRISEASKMVYSVELCLNSRACQFELINSVLKRIPKEKKTLYPAQLDIFSRLFNCILKNDETETCYSSAVQILVIASQLYQHSGDVAQFLYLSLQDHCIWKNIDFWVNYYFYETQTYLTKLYERSQAVSTEENDEKEDSNPEVVYHPQLEQSLEALDATSNILLNFEHLSSEERTSNEQAEAAFIYSQTIEFIYRMSYMQIDYESVKTILSKSDSKKESESASHLKLMEEKIKEAENFIKKFLQQINAYICLKIEKVDELEELIRYVVQAQYVKVESVCNLKSRSLASELSTKFKPVILHENETAISEIPGFLFHSIMHDEYQYDALGSLSLLPAQGVLYLTNYRIAFSGQPIDRFLSDNRVNISLPKKALQKLKLIEVSEMELGGQRFTTVLEIRTRLCYTIHFALPLESSSESLDKLKKNIRSTNLEGRAKFGTLRSESMHHKKDAQVKATGQTPKVSEDSQEKLINYSSYQPSQSSVFNKFKTMSQERFSKFDTLTLTRKSKQQAAAADSGKTLERRSSYRETLSREFSRMHISQKEPNSTSLWRVSTLNHKKNYTNNIPDEFIVPLFIQDDLYRRLFKYFRRRRIPVSTYVYGAGSDPNDPCSREYALFRSEAPLKAISALSTHKLNSKAGEIYYVLNGITTTVENSRKATTEEQSMIETLKAMHPDFQELAYLANLEIKTWRTVPLYVFHDRNFAVSNTFDKMATIHLDMLGVMDIKKSFSEFQRAFFPSPVKGKTKGTFLEIISKSKWMRYLRQAITVAAVAAFLGDMFCSSSYFSFGDGADMSSVLMCLTQILIDPHYRTIAGFQELIEKEWMEFNYNFYGKTFIEFIPVFILFLDCIYQITQQFPHAFEYNTYFLNFIAYHNFTARFHNFLQGDASIEPMTEDQGDLSPTITDNTSISSFSMKNASPNSGFMAQDMDLMATSSCIFSYISKYSESSTVFHNPYFDPNFKAPLHPVLELCCFDVWPFYYVHNFQFFCMYNLETLPSGVMNLFQSSYESENKSKMSLLSNQQSAFDNLQNLSLTTMTYTYTGDGSPFVMDSLGWMLHDVMYMNDELGNRIPSITDPIKQLSTPMFTPISLSLSENFQQFMNTINFIYRMTEPMKNIKNDGDKPDSNLHDLVSMEGFYPCECTVCGLSYIESKDFYYCQKCGAFIHHICQMYSDMVCEGTLRLSMYKSAESLDSHPQSTGFQLINDETMLHGVLYTKRLLSSWTPKHYVFNKKSQTLNVYLKKDINTIPIHSYNSSQLSNCKELKSLPSNVPKELQHVAGAFELKIKKKSEVFITPRKSEATIWFRTLSKFGGY